MKIQPTLERSDVRKAHELLARAINGRLSFGDGVERDNLDGEWISVTTPATPNTDFVVTHNLGRLPVGYWLMRKSAACDIYTGGTAATVTQLTLRATVASVDVVLFII